MSDSIYGKLFRVTTWGESHGKALGAVIDGCPAGLPLSSSDIQEQLDKRRPGQSAFTTKRNEADHCTILSGTFEGKTTGTPISVMIENKDHHTTDYSKIKNVFRPGHADFTYYEKYGIRDYRGGGRSSARETVGRVIGGAIAKKLLAELGISITAYTTAVGPVQLDRSTFDLSEIERNPLRMPCADTTTAEEFLSDCMEKGNSAGGIIECVIDGCPAGLGSPVFGKLDAALSSGIMSIGAVKGIEFGEGFRAATLLGSENNDEFYLDENERIRTATNHAGGILGGISTGEQIIFRSAIKPTPSISLRQNTTGISGQEEEISITGRHDPCVVPRACIVIEAMAALTLIDAVLQNSVARLDYIKDIYQK